MKLARTEFYNKGVQTFPVIKAVTIDADEVFVMFSVGGDVYGDVFSFATAAHVTVLETEPGENNYNEITFTPGSSAGAQAAATARLVDQTIPVITLVGSDPVALSVDDPYTDDGATALDDVDGDITADIVTVGDSPDTSVAGTYTVTYNVTDAAGNAAVEVTRTINVTA